MIRVRRVDGVAIVDWSHKDVAGVVPQLRTLLDARDARHVLLNMSEVESLKGEGLEALTEALTLCEDGGCTLGMYALNTYLTKLLEIMDLSGVMPPVLGAAEPEAISRVQKLEVSHASPRAEAAAAAAPAAEIVFEPVSTAIEPPGGAARPASRRVDGNADVEFELDLPEATGKRGRPAPAEIAATLKFDKQGVAGAPADEKPEDMLAVVWSELTMQGLRIGGPGGAELTARAQAVAPSSGASTAVL